MLSINEIMSEIMIQQKSQKMCFCLLFVIFFLTLSSKRNKVSGGHDRRSQEGGGAKVGVCSGRA